MNHQITHKLAAILFAVLMNGMLLCSVSYLFAAPAVALSQPAPGGQAAVTAARGVA